MNAQWMGVDVRDEQYHIFALAKQGEGKLVCCVGWVETDGEVRHVWESLGRPIFMQDAQPDTNATRKLVEGMGRRAKRGKFSKNLNSMWVQSVGEQDLVILNRPVVMEAVKAAIAMGQWLFPLPAWDVGAGVYKYHGDEQYEETLRHHFKAPTMIETENAITGNPEYDFPKDAMEGVDPHFYMAACLAYVCGEMKSGPAYDIVIPR